MTRIRFKKLKYLLHGPNVSLFKIEGKLNLANVLTKLVTTERFDILKNIILGEIKVEQVETDTILMVGE